jgi:type III pantothenate kinase
MLLAIDVGNTNTVFALHDGTAFVADWRCATEHQRTADEYFVWLSSLMSVLEHPPKVTEVIVSSVVPQVVFNLKLLSRTYFGCDPLVVGEEDCELGIETRVDANTNVGADRLVNTVGAFDLYGGDLVVVDFGTATTFDVVDTDGAYIGGIISPGVNLSVKALTDATAALPHVDARKPPHVVGTNTVHCMQSGVFWGYVSLIEGLCTRIADERNRNMTIVGTGGLSNLFKLGTDIFDHIDGTLTMHGLVKINNLNRKTPE